MHAHPRAPFLILPLLLVFTGCGYVHVGRAPDGPVTVIGDQKLVQENTDLRLEKKILQQELALTRAQGDALRLAIENRAADGDTSRRLTDLLSETSKELAALRANYAQLQAERAPGFVPTGDAIALKARLGETEEKLAGALRNYTELQEEVGRLKSAVTRARAENISLAAQARAATAQNEQAQAALAQLNLELRAHKDALQRAEQDAETLSTELRNVAPNSSVLAQLRTGSAADARSIALEAPTERQTETPASGSSGRPLVIRSVGNTPGSPGGLALRGSAVNATLVTTMSPAPRGTISRVDSDGGRIHIVSGGDTLAKISTQYYGSPGRWTDILSANRDVLGENNNLVIGRTLRIP